MIEGALIALGGVLVGIIVRSLPPRRRPPSATKPVCQCTHPKALHDPGAGTCHGLSRVAATGAKLSHHAPCGCRQYVGPEPLPEFFTPGFESS